MRRLTVSIVLMGYGVLCSVDAVSGQTQERLFRLSIADLMNVKVVSPSKKEQSLFRTPAAVYVITQQTIKRSGVTSLPDALRLAPGVQVSRATANSWEITIRGFSGAFANKLLVLIDGRSVYTPLFSGVYWDVQEIRLEDIERIEVIRGPGGSLWGANAVNGIINIITKSAEDTQGGELNVLGGSEELMGSFRYGGRLGERSFFRISGKYFDRDSGFHPVRGGDDWRQGRLAFRVEWEGERDELVAQGDIYDSVSGLTGVVPTLAVPYSQSFDGSTTENGGNVLLRWRRELKEASDLALQFYYYRTHRHATQLVEELRNTLDLDFQHRFRFRTAAKEHDLVWGLGYRFTTDDVENTFSISYEPASRGVDLFSAFVQDEITLAHDVLGLTVGSKFEHNEYSGFEFQPTLRLAWTPADRQVLWASFTRAVRTPARADHNSRNALFTIPPGTEDVVIDCVGPQRPVHPVLPGLVSIVGSSQFDSEKLLAYETGYRIQAGETLALDVTTFYQSYSCVRTYETAPPFISLEPRPHIAVPLVVDNLADGATYGLELTSTWNPSARWTLDGVYSYLRMDIQLDETSTDSLAEISEGTSPRHQLTLRSSLDLLRQFEVDATVRVVDNLPTINVSRYLVADLRLAWAPTSRVEWSIVGQNLFDNHHLEAAVCRLFRTCVTEVERSVYTGLSWRF